MFDNSQSAGPEEATGEFLKLLAQIRPEDFPTVIAGLLEIAQQAF